MSRALATALLGAALCLAGATFDSPSLYVPGVAMALLAGGAAAWVELAARGARLVRRAGPDTVVEGEEYALVLEFRSGALPPPGGELRASPLERPLPIAGRRSRLVRIEARFPRRGRRAVGAGMLVVRDPLRLHAREVAAEGGGEVLVLPRVEPVRPVRGAERPGPARRGRSVALAGRSDAAAAELEVDGLRRYREGAPASRIHWPAVARSGRMMERQLLPDLDAAPLVVLDAARPASEEALDAAVRAAASLCVHLARAGGCAALLPGERRPVEIGRELDGWQAVRARLALVEAGAGPQPGALAPRAGAVLWVTAADLSRSPRALERLPAAARFVVAPSAPPGGSAAFTVAGCAGRSLGRARRPRPAGRSAA